ncbi:hypothetical protein [Saccharolobus islandicus]|uniref:hypothetical protein n=1 Tax=Saccharolobus islandicus TaxID=43080 RepID=UPI00037B20C5|nr:hypothetical protein [Sulfolobus islandicus]
MDYKKTVNIFGKIIIYVRYGLLEKGADLVKAIAISEIINEGIGSLKYYNLRIPPDYTFLILTFLSFIFIVKEAFKYRKLYNEHKFYVIPYAIGGIILLASVTTPLKMSLQTEIIKDSIPLFVAITLARIKK